MTKRIVYTDIITCLDGSKRETLKVFTPTEVGLSTADLSELALAVVPKGISFKIIDQAEVPSDRTFRDAWKEEGESVGVDIVKAREVQKDRIRVARAPLMTELDYKQNAGEDVSVERQRLKDFTALVDSVSDVEELKTVIPVLEI